MAEIQTIQVGGQSVPVVPPDSYAVVQDFVLLMHSLMANVDDPTFTGRWTRAAAAAIGVCWRGIPPLPAYDKYAFDPLAYGGKVLDELEARGFIDADLMASAGRHCLNLSSGLPFDFSMEENGKPVTAKPLEQEVNDREDFTDQVGVPSTS